MGKKINLKWSLVNCAVGFSVISIMVTSNLISNFDNTITTLIQSNQSTVMTKLSKALALIGAPKLEAIIAVALIFSIPIFYRNYQAITVRSAASHLVLFATINVVTYVSNSILKHLFHRHRPLLHDIGGYSFPSDHAMMAFAFYITGVYLLWEHLSSRGGRILLTTTGITMTIVISLSRIYLNKHYPSDIIAGFFASGFILSAILLLWNKLEERYKLNST